MVQPLESVAACQLPRHSVFGRGLTGQLICTEEVLCTETVLVAPPRGTTHCHDAVQPFAPETACHEPGQSVAGRGASGHVFCSMVGSGGGIAGVFTRAVQFRSIIRMVRGPRTPHPVVAGVPLDTTLYVACHFWSAASVSAPKYPVCESLVRRPSPPRNRWSASTSSLRAPRARLRVNCGHVALCGVSCALGAADAAALGAPISACSVLISCISAAICAISASALCATAAPGTKSASATAIETARREDILILDRVSDRIDLTEIRAALDRDRVCTCLRILVVDRLLHRRLRARTCRL